MHKGRSNASAVTTSAVDGYMKIKNKNMAGAGAGAGVTAGNRALEVEIIHEVEAPIAGQDLTPHLLKGSPWINGGMCVETDHTALAHIYTLGYSTLPCYPSGNQPAS